MNEARWLKAVNERSVMLAEERSLRLGAEKAEESLALQIAAARKAADAILAPLTMEVGRLLEENPGAEVIIVAFGEEIKLTAKHFMDLYKATDDPNRS